MTVFAMRDDQREGERRERKDEHRVVDEPDGGEVAPTGVIGKIGAGREGREEGEHTRAF